MNEEQKLQLIADLLQQVNKLLEKVIKLMEFLVGEKSKKE